MGNDEKNILEETTNLRNRLSADNNLTITWQRDLKQTEVMLRENEEPGIIAKKLGIISENKELPYFTRTGLWRVIAILKEIEGKK